MVCRTHSLTVRSSPEALCWHRTHPSIDKSTYCAVPSTQRGLAVPVKTLLPFVAPLQALWAESVEDWVSALLIQTQPSVKSLEGAMNGNGRICQPKYARWQAWASRVHRESKLGNTTVMISAKARYSRWPVKVLLVRNVSVQMSNLSNVKCLFIVDQLPVLYTASKLHVGVVGNLSE